MGTCYSSTHEPGNRASGAPFEDHAAFRGTLHGFNDPKPGLPGGPPEIKDHEACVLVGEQSFPTVPGGGEALPNAGADQHVLSRGIGGEDLQVVFMAGGVGEHVPGAHGAAEGTHHVSVDLVLQILHRGQNVSAQQGIQGAKNWQGEPEASAQACQWKEVVLPGRSDRRARRLRPGGCGRR